MLYADCVCIFIRSVIGGDLVSKVATAHIASNGIGAYLIASTNTQGTMVYKLFGHI